MEPTRIEDPTIKATLPKSLLSAIGNTHVCLNGIVNELANMLDQIGWPEGDSREKYGLEPDGLPLADPLVSPPLNAVGYARANAQMTWVVMGLLQSVKESLGEVLIGDDGELVSFGNECGH